MCFLHALSSSTHLVQVKMTRQQSPKKESRLKLLNPSMEESHSSTNGTYVQSPLHLCHDLALGVFFVSLAVRLP